MSDAIELTAGGYRAVIDPRGAALSALTLDGRDLVWGYDPAAGPQAFQGQLLLPWPNRIDGGRYSFGGAEHRLAVNEPERGTAIHGLAYDRDWDPAETASGAVRLELALDDPPGYPFTLGLTAVYALDADSGLTVTLGARNTGTTPAPFGAGSHFYLTVGTRLDDAVLRLPAGLRLPVDGRLLPTGPPVPVAGPGDDFRTAHAMGAASLDTAFTGLRRADDGLAWTVLSTAEHAVGMWGDASYGWLQVFSSDGIDPRRGQLAVEPMTCPPNAFVSGEDLITLAPGESVVLRHGVRAVPPLTPDR